MPISSVKRHAVNILVIGNILVNTILIITTLSSVIEACEEKTTYPFDSDLGRGRILVFSISNTEMLD